MLPAVPPAVREPCAGGAVWGQGWAGLLPGVGSALLQRPARPAAPTGAGLCAALLQVATSGYLFCYQCVFSYVADRGRCPVTQVSTALEHVRKLYDTM